MNKKIGGTLLALALALSLGTQASANDFAFGFSPRTGDAYVDGQLGEMNRYAQDNTAAFIEDIAASFGVPRSLVREYYTDRRWAPGDIYYGCALAHQLQRPCGEVLHIYEQDHGQGWGAIAKRLGIKPGSPEFHALKGRVGQGHGKLKGKGGGPGKDKGKNKGKNKDQHKDGR